MKILLFCLIFLCTAWAGAAPDDAVSIDREQRVPYIVQGHEWNTGVTLVNICGEAQGYDLQFFSESGAPQSLSLLVPHDDENPEGKDVFKEVTGLKTNGERKPLEPGQSIYFWFGDTGADLRRAYGVFADDGGGCITGWSLYVYRRYAEEGMQTSSISFQEVSPRWAMEARVEAEYGCTTAYAISGDGSPVTMEINNWDGSVVGTIDLGPVYFHAFALIDHFPEGLISGYARIRGVATTVAAFTFCPPGKMWGWTATFRAP